MDTNNTSVQVNEFQALKSLIIAVEALAHDNSFKSASTVLEENAQLRKQIDSQQAEITKLTEREKELEVIKENTYREMFNINEKEKTNNVKAHEEIESLKAQILENEQIIAELKRTTDRLEKEVQDAKLIYSEEKKKVVQAHEDITKMQKAIKDTESKTDQYKTAGSRLKREYESLQTKYKDMETSKSLVEEENKQKSLQLDEIQGYTVQFYNDTEAVLQDKFFDLWEFCTKAMLVHLEKPIPFDRLQDPQAMRKLKAPSIMPHQVPLPPSNTNAAKQMRLAVILGLIARELTEHIFLPFYISLSDIDVLVDLAELARKDPKKESYCRAVLLAISPEKQETILEGKKKIFCQNVGSYLFDLLPAAQYDEFRQSLEFVVERACETWKFFQYSRNRYVTDYDLRDWGEDEWESFPFEENPDVSQQQGPISDTDEAVLSVFPRMCRLGNGGYLPINAGTALTKSQCIGAEQELRKKESSSPRAIRSNSDRQRTRGMSISFGRSADQNGSFLGDGNQASK